MTAHPHFFSIFLVLCCPQVSAAIQKRTVIETYINQEKVQHSEPTLKVPAGTNTLRFTVKPAFAAARYKLEGLEEDWNERQESMTFRVRFLDQQGDPLGGKTFPVSGKSPGWNGSLETSTFTPRSEKVTIPEGTVNMSFIFSSADPGSQLGIFAITDLVVTISAGDGQASRAFFTPSVPQTGSKGSWAKSGTRPTMAFVATPGASQGSSQYPAIRDNDLSEHADWISRTPASLKVTPGEILEIRWKEIYSTVLGGEFTATYERLPPGKYKFVVEDLSVASEPLKSANSISLVVPRVLWKRPWFWGLTLALLAGTSTWVGRVLIRRRIRFLLLQEKMISDERRRIALDLHDDLGTRLSHISLLASHADNTIQHEGAKDTFGKITSMSRDLIGALSETVWMLNSKNDDLESLIDFLYRLVNELCRLKKIRSRVSAVFITENKPISYEFRHNVSLAVKESVNNALKHSEATELCMSIELEKDILIVTITDNGIGFSEDTIVAGLGLESLERRMKSVGGSCKFNQLKEGGVRITLSAPVA